MDHEKIIALTREWGKEFGLAHSDRLIRLVDMLAGSADYDKEAIWLAAHLHDWGAYPPWVAEGVEHYIRSKEVAEKFLTENGCPSDLAATVLECIVNHHGGPSNRSLESTLFTDADALDLLGVVGVIRIISMCPRDLQMGMNRIQYWREISIKALSTEKAKTIATTRLAEPDTLLAVFQEETFGRF